MIGIPDQQNSPTWLRGPLPWVFIALSCFVVVPPGYGAEAGTGAKPTPAKLTVSGYGLLGNWRLKRTIRTIELGGRKPGFFTATFLEDATLLLGARLRLDGYLSSKIHLHLRLEDGTEQSIDTGTFLDEPLPREWRVTRAIFRVTPGPLYYYERIRFDGLRSISEANALKWFRDTGPLLDLKRMRIYTPDALRRGATSLEDELSRQGFEQARVEVAYLRQNDRTGAVQVKLQVEEGPRTIVRTVREELFREDPANPVSVDINVIDQPYSRPWLQDYSQNLRTKQQRFGYPDATVEIETARLEESADLVVKHLVARVKSGQLVHAGQVRLEGLKRSRASFVKRHLRVQRGELLNPSRIDQDRLRLARLGAFESAGVRYEPESGPIRDVIYEVKEGKQMDLNLLLGWGSYEMLRGGIIAEFYNILGLAHHARLKAVQSFKATTGEITYTIPNFTAQEFDLFFDGSALRREEISFTREEYGGGLGVHKMVRPLALDTTLRYNYQILNAASIGPAVATDGLTNPAVGAVTLDLRFDRRDNPLYPKHGVKVFLTAETATEAIGGDANYERVDLSASWHLSISRGCTLSLGLSHGAAISFGTAADNLPFNRRFFLGGANSIRGYQEGEASPRNEAGEIVGAESYMLGTVELEQALTPKWSVVAFLDALGSARRIEDYPFQDGLFSAGGGIRWRTLIGPVRLEYGHNLNPRPKDPPGTLQFSLGFPF